MTFYPFTFPFATSCKLLPHPPRHRASHDLDSLKIDFTWRDKKFLSDSPHDVMHQRSGEGVSEVYIRKLSWPPDQRVGSLSLPCKRMWISQSHCQTRKEISDIRIREAQGQPWGKTIFKEIWLKSEILLCGSIPNAICSAIRFQIRWMDISLLKANLHRKLIWLFSECDLLV